MKWFSTAGPAAAIMLALAACGSQKPAPVIDRTASASAPATRAPTAAGASTVPASGAREARDGVYTVQRGDTLYSIAHAFSVDFRDLARWNNVADPSLLSVGQSLRLTPPAEVGGVTVTPIAPASGTEVRPLPVPGAAAGTSAPLPPPTAAAAAKPESKPEARPEPRPATAEGSMTFQWPASGKVIEGFEEPRNKGIDIAGNDGDPVSAAADGEVVYVGSSLRGYGNLVIVKHSEDFISAYAHNRQILVKQGQAVKRGQRIAEMGQSDADRPKLHFEIRRQGKPVDPLRYLPPR